MQRDCAADAPPKRAVSRSENSGGDGKIRLDHFHFQASCIRGEAIDACVVVEAGFHVRIRSRHGQLPAANIERLLCSQYLGASERVVFDAPDDLTRQSHVDQFAGLTAYERPPIPLRLQHLSVSSRFNRVGPIGGDDSVAVFEFNIWRQRRVGLFHRRRESRQAMRRRQVIRHARFCPRRDRQRKTQRALTHQPNACRTLAVLSEELKSRDARQSRNRRERCDAFAIERIHQRRVRVSELAKQARRLLPFAFARDVRVVAAAEGED